MNKRLWENTKPGMQPLQGGALDGHALPTVLNAVGYRIPTFANDRVSAGQEMRYVLDTGGERNGVYISGKRRNAAPLLLGG